MLMTFISEAYKSITMFGDVGITLLKIMGYNEKALGTIKAEDIPAALQSLKNAVAQEKPAPEPKIDNEDDAKETPVSLAKRAFPLIEMLEASANEKCDVTWKMN